MANVGDKYIIEIGRANTDSDGVPYYSVKGAECKVHPVRGEPNFCPNCGADMREV